MIALVTCYFQHNYGSQLQALATQMLMDKLGFENETIRIDGLKPEINHAKYKYFLSKIFDTQTVKDKMATVRKFIAKKTKKDYASNLAGRDALFSNFAESQFYLSKCFDSKAELGSKAHDYDAFVVGSDQLWLPSNISADYYTLNFVPDDVAKIAYATSFGIASLPEKQADMARRFLPRFQNIFVRESSGQKLVKELIGKDVPIVCDPTLLFTAEEWMEKADADKNTLCVPEGEKYILCYFLGNNPQHRDYARRLAQRLGCRIVQLPNLDEYIKSDEGFADYPLYDIDAFGFIRLIANAEYVLTDSFHCTVFSNLFSKPFYTFRRYSDDGTASTNSRIYSLLDTLGLTDRLMTGKEMIDESVIQGVDFKTVHTKIDVLRKQSVKLLCQSLGI